LDWREATTEEESEMSKSIWTKMSEIDRRYLYWIIFLLLAVPYLNPLGLPVPVTETTKALYDKIETMGPKNVALFSIAGGVSAWAEIQPAMVAVMKHLVKREIKVVVWGFFIDQDLTVDMIVSSVPELKNKYKYGEDWVYMGYIAGGETAVAQLASDVHAVFKADRYGTPVDKLPLIMRVKSAKEIDLVLTIDTGSYITYYIRHWNVGKGTPVAEVGIAMQADYLVYYPVNLIAVLIGVRGGAEYEKLIGQLGDGTVRMDAINVSHVLFIAAIIMANLGYVMTRREKK
jgi:hypothetical protein